jgi:hypothetical protein
MVRGDTNHGEKNGDPVLSPGLHAFYSDASRTLNVFFLHKAYLRGCNK